MLSFESVSLAFSGREKQAIHVLDDVSLQVASGEFLVLIGPSGCGKSTLLNVSCGLLKPVQGEVRYAGSPIHGINTRVGYMTQRDTLLPWRTVEDNVGIALEIRKVKKSERRDRIRDALRRVNLSGFEHAYPSELSGGMRKRAILARTLIYDPETLLMDEPFADLDAQMRQLLQEQLLEIWDQQKKTVVFVTHDLNEAITMGDRIVAMTARPASIKRVFDVPLDRPRTHARADPRYGDLYENLWQTLRSEVKIEN